MKDNIIRFLTRIRINIKVDIREINWIIKIESFQFSEIILSNIYFYYIKYENLQGISEIKQA